MGEIGAAEEAAEKIAAEDPNPFLRDGLNNLFYFCC
jgi:hypothetical protein